MVLLWDYDEKELKKSRRGRILLLERKIDYGFYPSDPDEEKIDLNEVRQYWNELNIEPKRQRVLEYLLWKK